jgi:hypothetical protein
MEKGLVHSGWLNSQPPSGPASPRPDPHPRASLVSDRCPHPPVAHPTGHRPHLLVAPCGHRPAPPPLFSPLDRTPPTRRIGLKPTTTAHCDGFFGLIFSPRTNLKTACHYPLSTSRPRVTAAAHRVSTWHRRRCIPPHSSMSRRPDRRGLKLMWESHPSPTP